MFLKAFRVHYYRPILDSGWVDVDDIAVIVGKNESGKTALLKALHKFNPFKEEPYDLDREWPRGHRSERSLDALVVETKFVFSDRERFEIAEQWPGDESPIGVHITKTYKGEFKYTFIPNDFPAEVPTEWLISEIRELLGNPTESTSSNFKETISHVEEHASEALRDSGLPGLKKILETLKSEIDGGVQNEDQSDETEAKKCKDSLDHFEQHVDLNTIWDEMQEKIKKWLPTFVYMDDHKPYQGIAHLNQIKQRKDSGQLTPEDKTFLMILELAGLDFEKEFKRANTEDKEQRMLDMNDASLTLTRRLADHWSQRKYQVRLEADGYHVIAFVSDEVQPALVPLNERSKGFQWFFSFDTTFLYETEGTFKNAVILLDEPGLHLHAAAQRDLLVRLKDYARGNQLIYTTHMPFMIDMERLDNILVCTESKECGTRVSSDFYAADEHARFPLQAALGLSISQSLFVGPYNLVVEGITDYWLLSTMSAILRSEGKGSLDERIVVTPSGGATRAAYVGTMLQGQQLSVIVLLDSDPEGKRVAEGLIKEWIMKDRHVLLLGHAIGRGEETTLEDLCPADFYLEFVNKAYDKDLRGNPLTPDDVNTSKDPQIVRRIDAALQARGIPPNSEGRAFNKGRPAKLMLADLPKRDIANLPQEMVKTFEQLFQRVNEAMPGLNDKSASEGKK